MGTEKQSSSSSAPKNQKKSTSTSSSSSRDNNNNNNSNNSNNSTNTSTNNNNNSKNDSMSNTNNSNDANDNNDNSKKNENNKNDIDASNSNSNSETQSTNTTKSNKSSGIDAHPFARSSIIEVLWGVSNYSQGKFASKMIRKDDSDDDDGFSDDSDDHDESDNEKDHGDDNHLEDDDDKNEGDKSDQNENESKKRKGGSSNSKGIPRLCDIIDRVPDRSHHYKNDDPENSPTRWKYYVHYRDFNRRMDEWVTMDRIISPPSVGSAKAKALTQQQKKRKDEEESDRKKRKEEDRQKRLLAEIGVDADAAMNQLLLDQQNNEDSAGQRLTRRQRRKSRGDTVEDPSGGTGQGSGSGASTTMSLASGGTVVPGGVVKQQVGVDVVATVEAQELDEHEGLDEASLREHEEVTKVKNVAELQLGQYRMETWYFSPIPKELMKDGLVEVLYCCEFTLNFFTRKKELLRFQRKSGLRRHPPGNEIYRNGNLSMFEVDGFQERVYCQNLCYIAKLFLDHKTLYFDVDPFLFYVLCEVDNRGFHPVGYFSKEKYSDVGYNLACILTFPCHQRKGYGRFLISFSYELSKKEEKVGSPEKPMSDLGQKAYIPYWTSTIVDFLRNQLNEEEMGNISIMDMAKRTSIMAEDIIFTFNQLGILKFINGVYFIAAEPSLLDQLAIKHPVKEPRVDPTKLHWTPFLTDVKRDKFSIYNKKPNVAGEEPRGSGGF